LHVEWRVTGFVRISGTGPQNYRGDPGVTEVSAPQCVVDCEHMELTASAADMRADLRVLASDTGKDWRTSPPTRR
jgi:hypothetical protein